MTVFRETYYCPICGERIKEKHADRGENFVGDTFIGYEDHQCRKGRLRVLEVAKEKGLTGLVDALTSHQLNDHLDQLKDLGWYLCSTGNPHTEEEVLVTDGKNVGLGKFKHSWSTISHTPIGRVIAWQYKPEIYELQEHLKQVLN
jgi:hypothetical protein